MEGVAMKVFAAFALAAVMAGCASAPESASTPTHYWESAKNANENRYRMDNAACQAQVQAEQGSTTFDPGSQSFEAYQECMVSRGYSLRTY
jgi:hypothetical protein